jgi:hypothetical protein
MSFESSISSPVAPARVKREGGIKPSHFYLLLAMVAATAAVVLSPHTHPAALVLLSAAILAAGLVGSASHQALMGFFSGNRPPAPVSSRARVALEQDKALVLRSIKELEFDRAMGKMSDADFAEIGGRLRAKAMTIMEDLDRTDAHEAGGAARAAAGPKVVAPPAIAERTVCASCGKTHPLDARFCPHCGARL